MALDQRYEIVNTIAAGDFATVYRARDRELGREVAVKQIHQQFLSDPRQLERFWREAQILASLQHPNILTIYDVVRPRGWLFLELMRGNLQTMTRGQPIDLDYLRTVLFGSLQALQFLHSNGILHGDVKPTNLLVDSQNRVKLGDFGLARRASSQEGSLLKGTTKYMAPELVSNQFGPCGPASDLYSLGFSAYELMCGSQFESLFPGLDAFGRDRQIAWLMWHAAPDRNLPEIQRVLEGVPQDLAFVIQGMVAKDPARRFPTAQDAMQYLRPAGGGPIAAPPTQSTGAPQTASKKRLTRIVAIAALACSLLLSGVILFWSPRHKGPSAPARPVEPMQGIIRSVNLDYRIVVVERSDNSKPEEIKVTPRDDVQAAASRRSSAGRPREAGTAARQAVEVVHPFHRRPAGDQPGKDSGGQGRRRPAEHIAGPGRGGFGRQRALVAEDPRQWQCHARRQARATERHQGRRPGDREPHGRRARADGHRVERVAPGH
jgi:serine/threonine-protein kinase